MQTFVTKYTQKLQEAMALQELHSTMGWKHHQDKDVFVINDRMITPNAKPVLLGHSDGVDEICKWFKAEGSANDWVALTDILDSPGLEGHAFALLAGFGAPLMKFSGYPGAIISLVGETNAGKTAMLRWLTSIYGYFDELKAQKSDTPNNLFHRLGIFGNLPFVIDEITNISGMHLSEFVYTVTQGRPKNRLNKDASMKKNTLRWQTLMVSTSNERMYDKLQAVKGDASAEQMRIFEYELKQHPMFAAEATPIVQTIDRSYGHIGMLYLQELVNKSATLAKRVADKILAITGGDIAYAKERYWIAAAACSLVGGEIAAERGLIRFDVSRVENWVRQSLASMRGYVDEHESSGLDILGMFLNSQVNKRLTVRELGGKENEWFADLSPRGGAVTVRLENTNRFNHIYIDRQALYAWLTEMHYSRTKLREDLTRVGALLDENCKHNLTVGWSEFGAGAIITTWKIDANNPALGNVVQPSVVHEGNVAFITKGATK